MTSPGSLLVADIGNSTIDLGEFPADFSGEGGVGLPQPTKVGKFPVDDFDEGRLRKWLAGCRATRCLVGSVNQPGRELLTGILEESAASIRLLKHTDFQMPVRVDAPAAVGIDRIAGAVAANALRQPERPAIVISSGSAITINVVSSRGEFVGGMIAPGMHLSARTLSAGTHLLPMVRTDTSTPPMVGCDTVSAIRAGVFWMTVSGLDGMLARLQTELAGPCDLFGTGGSFPELLDHLGHNVRHEPGLVLSGLAMATS